MAILHKLLTFLRREYTKIFQQKNFHYLLRMAKFDFCDRHMKFKQGNLYSHL